MFELLYFLFALALYLACLYHAKHGHWPWE
jgi:hypothetical protein